jgi:hypothetical protein
MSQDQVYEFPGVGAVGGDPANPPVGSPLDALRAELAEDLTRDEPTETYPITARDGWAVRYSTAIDHELLRAWQRASVDGKTIDELALALKILAGQCRAIVFQDADVTDNGEPCVFYSPPILELTGTGRPVDAIRKLYRFDAAVQSTANAVLGAAGYGDEATPVDPTRR